jgi:hypothetical protein
MEIEQPFKLAQNLLTTPVKPKFKIIGDNHPSF